ncbi:transposase, partial [Clostridium botulinum C/D str. DC5]
WINTFSSEKETIRTKKLIIHSNIPHSYTMIKDFKIRQPIFI